MIAGADDLTTILRKSSAASGQMQACADLVDWMQLHFDGLSIDGVLRWIGERVNEQAAIVLSCAADAKRDAPVSAASIGNPEKRRAMMRCFDGEAVTHREEP